MLEQVRGMLMEAMDEDEVKNWQKALELYTEVLDFAGELLNNKQIQDGASSLDQFSQSLKKLLKIAFERECDLQEKRHGFDK